MASSGDLLLNERKKKPFVSLKDEVTISANSFIFVFFVIELPFFYSLESGIDSYFSWNCDIRFWRAKQ